ncbi:MAG: hypothetical protein K2I76_00840 [Malacoplasma sp.]|nr:hypothetical protein [Malacoplasma sp.]
MFSKIKIIFYFVSFFFIVLILFSVFFEIQTFFTGMLVSFNSLQIVQIKKEKNISFYKNQNIYIKEKNSSYKVNIINIDDDANFYYLTLDKYFYNYKETENLLIYDKKVKFCEFIINSFFDF